jgi:hypothetical protein
VTVTSTDEPGILLPMRHFVTLCLLALPLLRCDSSPPMSQAVPAAIVDSASHVLAQLVATANPQAGTLTFSPAQIAASISPQALKGLTIDQAGGGDAQPANTVDLVSTDCMNNFSTGGHVFQCNVELRSFFPFAVQNVYAQVTSITASDGGTVVGYQGINSTSDSTYSPPLSNALGLWGYNNGSTNGSFLSAYVSGQPSGLNSATQTWEFENADNQIIQYGVSIWGTIGYSSYSFGFAASRYVDACTGGTSTTNDEEETLVNLPFDFAIYSDIYYGTTQKGGFGADGIFTFGRVSRPPAQPLPNSLVSYPAIFPFWDNLVTTSGGQICYQTFFAAPNRKFVVEWQGMNFGNAPGNSPPSSLDFEVLLFEGSGEIDTIYHSMVGGTGSGDRQNGSMATIGVQDGTHALYDYEFSPLSGGSDQGYYATGSSNSYIPHY